MWSWQGWVAVIAVQSVIVLVAYVLGKRAGRQCESKLSAARVPLTLRAEALVTGRCPVCDGTCEAWYNERQRGG